MALGTSELNPCHNINSPKAVKNVTMVLEKGL